jgi:hypothetical protein
VRSLQRIDVRVCWITLPTKPSSCPIEIGQDPLDLFGVRGEDLEIGLSVPLPIDPEEGNQHVSRQKVDQLDVDSFPGLLVQTAYEPDMRLIKVLCKRCVLPVIRSDGLGCDGQGIDLIDLPDAIGRQQEQWSEARQKLISECVRSFSGIADLEELSILGTEDVEWSGLSH